MKTDPYAFKPCDLMGEPTRPEPGRVALDEWAKLLDPDTKQSSGFVKRVRMRLLGEVFADLRDALDVVKCDRCGHEKPREDGAYCEAHDGCGGEYEWFIDEYFSGPWGDDALSPVPHDYRWVACFPVTGGSEGWYIHVSFICQVAGHVAPGSPNVREVRLALGKTFRSMKHACEIANRCAVLLGA